jgi:cytidylate kinase
MQAPDAEYVDSSRLAPEQVEEAILKIIRRRTSN